MRGLLGTDRNQYLGGQWGRQAECDQLRAHSQYHLEQGTVLLDRRDQQGKFDTEGIYI